MEHEKHAGQIVTSIADLKSSVMQSMPARDEPVFITVWDFDGTILKGDCVEGYSTGGRNVYRGLAQAAIEAGLCNRYAKNEYERFWHDFQGIIENEGVDRAYAFIPTVFAGQSFHEMEQFSMEYFLSVLCDYYFESSVSIIRELKSRGIEPYLVSASPEFFVRSAGLTIDIPAERIRGMSLYVENGYLTDRLRPPLCNGPGKVDVTRTLMEDIREQEYRQVFILAGFGNSYHSDGPFLKWIAGRQIPGGEAFAYIINGDGTPSPGHGEFIKIDFSKTVSTCREEGASNA